MVILMRVRNIKNKQAILDSCKMYLAHPEQLKGKWQEEFKNNHPIHVEIGCGKCQFIIEKSRKNPNINFIGIERIDTVLALGVKELEEELPNLRLINFDANKIEEIFNKEISCLYLNFSDPWPKNRHEKRRLTHENFLKKYEEILINKTIIQKTDNQNLFEFSLISYNKCGFLIEEISLDLQNSSIDDNIKTEYEEKFMKKGCKIFYVKVGKSEKTFPKK